MILPLFNFKAVQLSKHFKTLKVEIKQKKKKSKCFVNSEIVLISDQPLNEV